MWQIGFNLVNNRFIYFHISDTKHTVYIMISDILNNEIAQSRTASYQLY